MRKQLKIFVIMLTIVLGSFGFVYRPLFHAVKATYFEGPITQDTIWTLIDSPIVVSQNVTVCPGATLTIEPGVEVRFGKNFALIINGTLSANGNNRAIAFTSNREQPAAGDWFGIISNSQGTTVLTECSITFANDGVFAQNSNVIFRNSGISYCLNGMVAQNSNVTVTNSIISHCLQNGINATSSQLTASGTQILENNGANGMSITGNGTFTIQNNTIMENMNGMLLTGDQTSGVSITQNRIYANTQNGIMIDAITHNNISIENNIISANNTRGLYISSPTPITDITHNSVFDNNIGFFYELGNSNANHTTEFNDIYNNAIGMDVTHNDYVNDSVNATSNYWGSPDGPYNEWLNPEGKGNPVGGNGVDLGFVFWLTRPVNYINTPPTAKLLVDKTSVTYGQDVMFIASNSYGEGHIDWYKFDYGNSQTSGWTTLSIFAYRYPFSLNENYTATVTVLDDFGGSDTDNITVSVRSGLGVLEVSTNVSVSNPAVDAGENVSFIFAVTYASSPVQDANVTMFAVRGGDFSQSFGSTDANGTFSTVFTMPYVAQETNVRVFARASKSGYADGVSDTYLEVKPILSVEVQPASATVKSEGIISVTVYITNNGEPIQNAFVTLTATIGTLSLETGFTEADGSLSFNLTAPYTSTDLTATITANAKKDKYGDASGQTTITIRPKILEIMITTEPYAAFSGEKVNVTVHIGYEMSNIEGASIAMTAENGSFLPITGLTDFDGSARFVWTAPQVNTQTSFWINASVATVGYDSNSYRMEITVNPKTFNITTTISSSRIESEETKTIAVYVGCIEDGNPVANASITILANEGTVFAENQTTNSEGLFIFNYTAPKTTVSFNTTVTVEVAQDGYANGVSQTEIRVNPRSTPEAGGGWPILTILLIMIPVIVVVIIAVLAKLKVIEFSSKEESQG